MNVDIRSLPGERAIRADPAIFAGWMGSEVLPSYTMAIGADAYEYWRGDDCTVRFYPRKGMIVVPDDDSVNLNYLYAKLYEFGASGESSGGTTARDMCIAAAVLYVWYWFVGSPWPVPPRFCAVTVVILAIRLGVIPLVGWFERRREGSNGE